jgi:hypothetical protein
MNCLLSLFYDAYFLKGKKNKYKNTLVSFQCRLTRQVSHVEQEPLTLPEHMGSTPGFNGFNVARFLAFCVMFCKVVVCPFSFGHCIVCTTSLDGF